MRAGLSTRWDSYGGLISIGTDLLFEFCSLGWRHRFEEGLHPFYPCFNQLSVSRLGTVSGIVSFSSARIALSSYMRSVSSVWCVGCLCGTRSTSRRVGCLWARFHVLAYPSQERSSSGCHVVVRVLFVHLVSCLPNVLCRSGFRKEVKSDVTAKERAPWKHATVVARSRYGTGIAGSVGWL